MQAEVVGKDHSFLTRKWDADWQIDQQHWGKFPAFAQRVRDSNASCHLHNSGEQASDGAGVKLDPLSDGYVYDFEHSDYVFLRWKVSVCVNLVAL